MTIAADIPKGNQDLITTMRPMEMESQQPTAEAPKETTVEDSVPSEGSKGQRDTELPGTTTTTEEPETSPSESAAAASGGDLEADPSKADNENYLQNTTSMMTTATVNTTAEEEPSTEVVYLEKPLPRRRPSTVNVLLMILLPLAFALIIALIAVSQKHRARTTTLSASSFDFTGEVTCGCTTCSQNVLDTMTQEGTTCLQEITTLMSQLGLDESQACMLIGQQFPASCGACDASICNRRVGTCGCPTTCTDSLLATMVTDDAGDYSCKDRMQFIMDTKGVDESTACNFVSDEFPQVCGTGCRASECQGQEFDYGTDKGGLGTAASTGSDVCPTLVWQDEFNGNAVDTSNWNYQLGDGCSIGLCAWGNGELQSYQSDNAFIADGKLVIEARNTSDSYTSARLTSKGLLDFRYGYVESSIQIPTGNGMWPAFWALPTDQGMLRRAQ